VFKKLFGKKNDGFYMQVDDVPTPKVPAKAQPAATVVAAAAAVVSAPTEITTADRKIADAEKAVAKAAAKTEKKSAKKAAEEQKVVAVAPAPVAPPKPITNFATDYLIKPSSDSNRRRPGANMSKFLELAREAKIPVNIKK
jgi:hypothetical protein